MSKTSAVIPAMVKIRLVVHFFFAMTLSTMLLLYGIFWGTVFSDPLGKAVPCC